MLQRSFSSSASVVTVYCDQICSEFHHGGEVLYIIVELNVIEVI